MDRGAFAARIDHTVLGPETTLADVESVVTEAATYGMNACIPPGYLADVAEIAADVTLVTVCGFPHGQSARETKVYAAEQAWQDGADELDVVINVGRLHAGDTDAVHAELEHVVTAVPIPVKVIVEAPLLTESELRTACDLAANAGAAYVKTATGFAAGGATIADVEIMAEYLPVKASGGISRFREAAAMLSAGADRIGASAGDSLVEEFEAAAFDG